MIGTFFPPQTRAWPHFRRVHPIMATHPPSNGQKRVHPEAAWPEPRAPLSVTLTARSHQPKPAYTRGWPLFKRLYPILATYPPIDYPFSMFNPATRLSIPLPDYGGATRSVAHMRKHTRTRTHPRPNVQCRPSFKIYLLFDLAESCRGGIYLFTISGVFVY